MFFQHFTFTLLTMAGFLAIWFSDANSSNNRKIYVAGSTTVLPIVARAAQLFKEKQPNIIITVNAGGSGVGFNSVTDRRVDIGLMSRDISPAERKKITNLDIKVFTIAHDGVACVVSSEIFHAGVTSLTREEIRDIYLGRKKNWKEFGGPDRPVLVIDKERHRGTRHAFMGYIMGNAKARAPGVRLVTGSNNEEQAKIAQSNAAIGMLSHAWTNKDVVGIGIREGDKTQFPTLENILSNNYPISRNLNLVTVGEPAGSIKSFINFILGPQGRKIIEDSGYVAVH